MIVAEHHISDRSGVAGGGEDCTGGGGLEGGASG